MVDLEAYVNNAYPRLSGGRAVAAGDPRQKTAIEAQQRKRVIEQSAAAIEALLAMSQLPKAKRIAERAFEFTGLQEARPRFARAAQRAAAAGSEDFEKWLGAQVDLPSGKQ
jgi:hypothetical protein